MKHHSKSEEYASQAEVASRKGDLSRSIKLYQLAAKEEEIALSKLDPVKKRTFGITAVSAASLWFKGKDFKKAASIAYKYLGSYSLPPFAIIQLQDILETIWKEESWQNRINLYSQIRDIDEACRLVYLNCKFDKNSDESFEKAFPLSYFKDKDELVVDTPVLVQIFERPGEVKYLFEYGEENYFAEDEEYIDISDLEDSPIFKPISINRTGIEC
jgi:hypothetical protein